MPHVLEYLHRTEASKRVEAECGSEAGLELLRRTGEDVREKILELAKDQRAS